MAVFDDLREIEEELETLTHRMGGSRPCERRVLPRLPIGSTSSDSEFRARDGYTIEAKVGHRTERARLPQRGLDATNRRVLGRLADAHRAGETASGTAEYPAAGRADEPPGPGSAQLAGGVPDRLSVRVRADLARPVFPGCHGREDRRILEQASVLLLRQLREISGAEGGAQGATEAAYKNQQERIEQLEAFINRFRAQATKAKQVQSRIKELEKIERIEIPPEEQTIHFSFPQPKPSGRIVAEFQNVSKSYGAKHVFSEARISSSSAATASRWSGSTGRGNRL